MAEKFLHKLEAAEDRNSYLVAGRIWKGWDFSSWDQLNLDNEDGASLSVKTTLVGEGFVWEYHREIATDVTFRQQGAAASVEAACLAALEFLPESMTLEYLGRSIVCYGKPGHRGDAKIWTIAVDGEMGEVIGPLDFSTGARFSWRRNWLPGKELLEQFCDSSGDLSGRSLSMRDAVIAVVDAPELFKRACGKLISTLVGSEQ